MVATDRRGGERWERILTKYGAATAIALFLVWWLASDVSGQISAVRATLAGHVVETNFYLRQICLNTSKDPQQAMGCNAR